MVACGGWTRIQVVTAGMALWLMAASTFVDWNMMVSKLATSESKQESEQLRVMTLGDSHALVNPESGGFHGPMNPVPRGRAEEPVVDLTTAPGAFPPPPPVVTVSKYIADKQGDTTLRPRVFEGAKKTNAEMVFFCLSRRDAFGVRQTIRETWASGHENVYFVVGSACPVPPSFRPEKPKGNCKQSGTPTPEKQTLWDARSAEEDAQLDKEQATHGDLARMPGLDSYTSLPQKLKFAYKWGIERTEALWFVKVDDDTVARIGSLEAYVKGDTRFVPSEPTLIGGAGTSHVARSGTWAEHNYRPNNYPPYPMGSKGHIVSRPVAEYVGTNSKSLFDFQGEDTSLGIWLDESPLKPQMKYFLEAANERFVGGNNRDCMNPQYLIMGHR